MFIVSNLSKRFVFMTICPIEAF